MTKEQEAQQEQTIKRIGEMLNTPWGHDVGVWVANCEDLREIVDSQAQKIAEQAKQIERLKSAHKIPCVHCDSTGGFNVESTGEIITCERCGGAGYHLLTTDSKEVAR